MIDLWLHELPVLLHAGFITAAPLIWAAIGGNFSERAGIVNIGLEGMMLFGAFVAVVVSGLTGDPWLGIAAGALAGGAAGFTHGLICLWGKADQIVSGMGMNLMAYGITGFFLMKIFSTRGNSPEVTPVPSWHGVSGIPFLSDLLFPLSPLHILLLVVVVASLFLLYQTRFGLRLRACGEEPDVVRAAGVNVSFYRYTAVTLSGILAGLGGVQLSLCDMNQFSVMMTNGRGFIALAALICSGWRPGRAAWICLFFGTIVALADRLQSILPGIPSRGLLALPFILALLVLAFSRLSANPPKSLGRI
jgi:general nucleoside transport system permease protein